MCRWMAYKGQSVYLDEWILNSEHSLIDQSKSADMTKYEVNGDGFGVGWYGDKKEPGLFRSIRPAWNNANLKSLASHVSSPLFLAHVRAATGTPIQETNSHPFKYKNWLMVHNGLIHEFGSLKKEILSLINSDYFLYICGSTDSELIFYLLLTNGLEKDIKFATEKTIQQIESIAEKYNIKPALRMTLGISDGESVWAIRYSSHANSSTLFYSMDEENGQANVLVVSEPLDSCDRCWTPVDENTIMHFDKDIKTCSLQMDI